MKLKEPFPIKIYWVKSSRRHPDTGEVLCRWEVELESDGSLHCNCPAGSFSRECRHKAEVRKFIQKNEPEKNLKPMPKKRTKRENNLV